MTDFSEPPAAYAHTPEAPFEDQVATWFRARYGEENVTQQHYQSEPRWFVDIRVDVGYATLYIETESRSYEVRSGVAQSLGYSAEDLVAGVPMVIAPKGHIQEEKINRLRQSTTVAIREFDEEKGVFVR